jgi:hypothetical protein
VNFAQTKAAVNCRSPNNGFPGLFLLIKPGGSRSIEAHDSFDTVLPLDQRIMAVALIFP